MTAGQHHRSSLILHFTFHHPPKNFSLLGDMPIFRHWLSSALDKKNFPKNPKKKKYIFFIYCMLWGACFVNLCLLQAMYINMYKILKNIVFEPFSAFKIIKVTALPIYYFLFWKIKILFVINAGIEPAFILC